MDLLGQDLRLAPRIHIVYLTTRMPLMSLLLLSGHHLLAWSLPTRVLLHLVLLAIVLCLVHTFGDLLMHVIFVVVLLVSWNILRTGAVLLIRTWGRPVNEDVLLVTLAGAGLDLGQSLVAATMMELLGGWSVLWSHIWVVLYLRLSVVFVLDETLFVFHKVVVLFLLDRDLRVNCWMMLSSYADLRLRTLSTV